jgi:hypothetical protein
VRAPGRFEFDTKDTKSTKDTKPVPITVFPALCRGSKSIRATARS